MNIRQISIIGGAILVAGGAFVWMRSQSASPQVVAPVAAEEEKTETVNVLVAKRDLRVGERISPASLTWASYTTTSAATPGFYLQTKSPDAIKNLSNGIVRQSMVAGEPILTSKIVDVDVRTGSMAALLTPGMRATSFPISPESSVSGFVLPNDRVDVVLTREVQFTVNGQTQSRVVASTIMENVRVLAIDQAVTQVKDEAAISGSTATVELNAADAEKLRLAQKLGDLSLLLRGYADAGGPTIVRSGSVVLSQQVTNNATDMAASDKPVPTQQANDGTPPAVKVYRGGQ